MSPSKYQFATATAVMLFVTPVAFGYSTLATVAGEDFWISVPLAFLLCASLFWIVSSAGKIPIRTGKRTAQSVRWLLVIMVYLYVIVHLFEFVEMIRILYLAETPISITLVFLGLLCTYISSIKMETTWILTEFCYFVSFLTIVLLASLVLPQSDFGTLRPFLAKGLMQPLNGAMVVTGWLLDSVLLAAVNEQGRYTRAYFAGVALGFIIYFPVVFATFVDLSVQYAQHAPLASYLILINIKYAEFLSGFESIFDAVWVFSLFTKTSIMILIIRKYLPQPLWIGRIPRMFRLLFLFMLFYTGSLIVSHFPMEIVKIVNAKWIVLAGPLCIIVLLTVMLGKKEQHNGQLRQRH